MKNILKLFLFLQLLIVSICYAQTGEDTYRLSYLGLGVGARSLGIGTAYTGVASDFSAVYWNPAGLGQIQMNEFSVGLSHISYNDQATFLGNKKSMSNSLTALNDFGLVYPFPVSRGSMVFALGYNRQIDFTTALGFDGYNDSTQTIFEKPFLKQRASIFEDGGINNWVLAGAIEAAKGLYVGVSFSIISGSYSYNRDYYESDVKDVYNLYSYNRKYLIDEEIGGLTGRVGLLYVTPNGNGRVGMNVKLPSHLWMTDNWSEKSYWYDDNPNMDTTWLNTAVSEFEITTPFVISAGGSYSFDNLMLTGSFDYTDWTQMKFINADLMEENTIIKEDFQPTMNFRVGTEYSIPNSDFQLRAGFAYLPSPYQRDASPNDQKYITGGFGWIIDNSVKIDLGYSYGFWVTDHDVYYARTSEKIHTHNVIATLSYRF